MSFSAPAQPFTPAKPSTGQQGLIQLLTGPSTPMFGEALSAAYTAPLVSQPFPSGAATGALFRVNNRAKKIEDPALLFTQVTVYNNGTPLSPAAYKRLGGGYVWFPNGVPGGVSGGLPEIQTITMSATGGTFLASHPLSPGQTVNLPYNISPANLQAALAALFGIGVGNLTVTGTAGTSYTLTFAGALAPGQQPLFVLTTTNLTGGSATITETQAGTAAITMDAAYIPTIVAGVTDVQTLTASAALTAGNYTVGDGTNTTAAIAYNATVAQINSALAAATPAAIAWTASGAGPVSTPNPITFTATGVGPRSALVVTPTGLTGGTLSFTRNTAGVAAVNYLYTLPETSNWNLVDNAKTVTDEVYGEDYDREYYSFGNGSFSFDMNAVDDTLGAFKAMNRIALLAAYVNTLDSTPRIRVVAGPVKAAPTNNQVSQMSKGQYQIGLRKRPYLLTESL